MLDETIRDALLLDMRAAIRELREAKDEIAFLMIPAEPITEPERPSLGYPDEAETPDPRDEELERLRARVAELEAEAPPLLPDLGARMGDYVPAEIRDLMEDGETFAAARKRLSELLNVEKAELRLKRAAGSATKEELKREADVDRLQGLFSKLGEI